MFNKITTFAIALVIATQPFAPQVALASSGTWDAPLIEAAWNYGDYRVERLAFTDDTIGPISLGDLVVVADPADSCNAEKCEVYHLTMLKNGLGKTVTNVPDELLDETRYHLNGDRLVYIYKPVDEENRFTVVELDEDLNQSQVLVEGAYFPNVIDIDVMVDGRDIYFNPEFENNDNKNGYKQKAVYIWDPKSDLPDIIGDHWVLRRENLLDVQDGIALTSWEFDRGNEQLWFMNTQDEKNRYFEAVPYTWTEPDGDIVGAHFKSDGSIEYFQYFVRYTYDPAVDTRPVAHKETLTWYRDVDDALQIVGDKMAWVNADDTLFVSDGKGLVNLGLAPSGIFTLQENRIFYSTATGGAIYDFATRDKTVMPFGVTDVQGDVVVGVDAIGNIQYQNLTTGKTLEIGQGSNPVISDPMHIYWRGADENIYEATISPLAGTNLSPVSAIKTSDSPKVYLISGIERQHIPSEDVYFTWFDSWSDVTVVSSGVLGSYIDKGKAKVSPGTKVKMVANPKVYVMGDDGKLHWITTQTVAYSIYGSGWSKDIVEMTNVDLINYTFGTSILTEADYLVI